MPTPWYPTFIHLVLIIWDCVGHPVHLVVPVGVSLEWRAGPSLGRFSWWANHRQTDPHRWARTYQCCSSLLACDCPHKMALKSKIPLVAWQSVGGILMPAHLGICTLFRPDRPTQYLQKDPFVAFWRVGIRTLLVSWLHHTVRQCIWAVLPYRWKSPRWEQNILLSSIENWRCGCAWSYQWAVLRSSPHSSLIYYNIISL